MDLRFSSFSSRLTFTGAALAYEPHHEGGAAVALGGRVEGLHHELMCFGLQGVGLGVQINQ